MKRKIRPAKKNLGSLSASVEALVGEVQSNIQSGSLGADAFLIKLRPLSPEEMKDLFRALLQKGNDQTAFLLEAICGKDEKVDLALAESFGLWFSPRAADLLHRLSGATSSKAVIKAIRRSIFQLKSRGLEAEEISDRAAAVYHPPQPAASEGFLTPIDSTGHRVVLLARPQIPQGMAAFSTAISDREGIVDFSGFETSRKNFHEYLEMFREQYPGEVVEADPDYCAGLIVEAAEIGQEKGTAPSPEFMKWRPLMGPSLSASLEGPHLQVPGGRRDKIPPGTPGPVSLPLPAFSLRKLVFGRGGFQEIPRPPEGGFRFPTGACTPPEGGSDHGNLPAGGS